jgi:hypothetical protein
MITEFTLIKPRRHSQKVILMATVGMLSSVCHCWASVLEQHVAKENPDTTLRSPFLTEMPKGK